MKRAIITILVLSSIFLIYQITRPFDCDCILEEYKNTYDDQIEDMNLNASELFYNQKEFIIENNLKYLGNAKKIGFIDKSGSYDKYYYRNWGMHSSKEYKEIEDIVFNTYLFYNETRNSYVVYVNYKLNKPILYNSNYNQTDYFNIFMAKGYQVGYHYVNNYLEYNGDLYFEREYKASEYGENHITVPVQYQMARQYFKYPINKGYAYFEIIGDEKEIDSDFFECDVDFLNSSTPSKKSVRLGFNEFESISQETKFRPVTFRFTYIKEEQ